MILMHRSGHDPHAPHRPRHRPRALLGIYTIQIGIAIFGYGTAEAAYTGAWSLTSPGCSLPSNS